jgi:hypothetical protein
MSLLALAVAVATALGGQTNDEAQAILNKALKAHFPKGKDDKNTAYQGKNKGTIYVAGLELEFTQEISVQTPGKFKEVMDLTVMNQAVKTVTVFNGKEGWIKVNDKDIKVDGAILDEFKEIAYWMSVSQFSGFKEKGIKLSLLGEVQVNGKPALGVKLSKDAKKEMDMYFDKKTGLLAKTERRTKDLMSGQEVTEERIVTEYQDVKGQQVAKKVIVNRDGKKLMEAEVLETRFLEKLDDAEFAQP